MTYRNIHKRLSERYYGYNWAGQKRCYDHSESKTSKCVPFRY